MPPGKDMEVAHSAEISRLNALITKDPRSKLFMPLAEEYMKAGMTDRAVETLERGLMANPFYMSARVMLGKARLEKGETDAAREEFELVVKAVPDNLFAHRKLGEIYWQQGRPLEAARAFRMVTILNPMDEEARQLIGLIESGVQPATAKAELAEPAEAEPHSMTETDQEMPSPPHQEEAAPQAFDISEPEEPEADELETESEPQVIEIREQQVETSAWAEEALEAVVVEPMAEATFALEEAPAAESPSDEEPQAEFLTAAEEASGEEEPGTLEEPGAAPAYSLDISGDAGLDDILSAYSEPALADESSEEAAEESGGVYEIQEESSAIEIEGLVVNPPQNAVQEAPAAEDAFATKTLAELYCAQGFYDRAIGIYKELLADDPDNKELKAKLEELFWRAGVVTAGAAPEAKEYPAGENGEKIRRLEQFLDAIKRKAGR